MEPVNRSIPNDEIAIPDENKEKAPTYNQWSAEELEEHGPCEHWPLAEFKPDHNARRYPLELLKIRLCVRWEGHVYPMQTKLYDINTTRKAFMNAWGPSYHDDDNCYELQLVGLNPRTKGFQKVVARRPLTIGLEECPARAWKIDSSQYGGKLPESLEEHIKNRDDLDGQYVDPESAEEEDGVWEADESRDSRGYDRGDARGGRGRDRDPMNDRFPDDPRGPHDPFGGAAGGYGPATQGFPGASQRGPYGAAPPAALPPPMIANGHVWTGSPPGFNPPERGEWKHCPTGQAVWTGNHYEPAPPVAAGASVAATAEEQPPIVNGLLRLVDGSYVPCPFGTSRVSAGNWVPKPDPNALITNPARQLAEPPPPYPDKIEGTNQFLLNGEYKDCPHGIYYSAPLRQWIPKPDPPPVAKPAVEEKPQKMTLAETLALITGAGTALASIFGAVQGPRLENERAAEERRREEAKAAVERAKAEADAAKENARVLADAQREAAKLQADAQIKAAELAAERDREARAADERRRTEMADFAREDRKREEDRREEQRKREHELLLKRSEEEATERRRREDREREDRAAADARMEKMFSLAVKPPPVPVDPALEDLKRALNDAKREASKGGDFAAEFKKMRSLAEAMGAKFGDAAPGPTSDPDIVGPIVMSAVEKTFEFVDRYIKTRESAPRQPAAQPVAITQHPPRPMVPPYPPPAGHFWGFDPRTSQFIAVPMPTQPAPVQLPPVPAAPQFAQPSEAPDGVVTNGPAYVQPAAEQPPPAGESAWSVAEVPPAEEPPPAPVANEAPPPVF